MKKDRYSHYSAFNDYFVVMLKADGSYAAATFSTDDKRQFPTFKPLFPKNVAFDSSVEKAIYSSTDWIKHEGNIDENITKQYIRQFYNRGIEIITQQFLALRDQVKPWLKTKYQIVPNLKDFIAWYGKDILMPHISKQTCLLWWGQYLKLNTKEGIPISKSECYAATSYPKVRPWDLQKYCLRLDLEMLQNDQQLRLLLQSNLTRQDAKDLELGTYNWIATFKGEGDTIDELYTKINGKFVECTLEEFRAIFGKAEFVNPVIWKSGNITHLLYFINQLQELGFIEKTRRQNWALLKKFFKIKGKTVIKANFNVIYNRIEEKVDKGFKESISRIIDGLDNFHSITK
jgi:hypothetical protein